MSEPKTIYGKAMWMLRKGYLRIKKDYILKERKAGKLLREIAEETGISITHVQRICKGGLRERSDGTTA